MLMRKMWVELLLLFAASALLAPVAWAQCAGNELGVTFSPRQSDFPITYTVNQTTTQSTPSGTTSLAPGSYTQSMPDPRSFVNNFGLIGSNVFQTCNGLFQPTTSQWIQQPTATDSFTYTWNVALSSAGNLVFTMVGVSNTVPQGAYAGDTILSYQATENVTWTYDIPTDAYTISESESQTVVFIKGDGVQATNKEFGSGSASGVVSQCADYAPSVAAFPINYTVNQTTTRTTPAGTITLSPTSYTQSMPNPASFVGTFGLDSASIFQSCKGLFTPTTGQWLQAPTATEFFTNTWNVSLDASGTLTFTMIGVSNTLPLGAYATRSVQSYNATERITWTYNIPTGTYDIKQSESVTVDFIGDGGVQAIDTQTGVGSASGETVAQSTVELLDGRSFINSMGTLSASPATLSEGGLPVVGVGADGTALVLVRLTSATPTTFSVSIADNDACNSHQDDADTVGGVKDATVGGSDFTSQLTVQTQSIAGANQAYLWYEAPNQYIRKAPCAVADAAQSTRHVSLNVVGNDSFGGMQTVNTVLLVTRVPIVLVHGLWSGPDTWQEPGTDGVNVVNMQATLQKNLGFVGTGVFVADYELTSASSFQTNSTEVQKEIERATSSYLVERQMAVVKADVVGHSMGGVLARIWINKGGSAEGGACSPGTYLGPQNFCKGDVNRLIVIGSPMFGSFWADILSTCTQAGADSVRCAVLRSGMAAIGRPIDAGAIDDLRTEGSSFPGNPLQLMREDSNLLGPPVHAIVGDAFPGGQPIPGLINTVCPYPLPICRVLQLAFDVGLPSPQQLTDSDGIVGITSQGGRLPLTAQSTPLPVPHLTLGSTLLKNVIPGETSDMRIANELIRLLNEQTTASDYEPYFTPSN